LRDDPASGHLLSPAAVSKNVIRLESELGVARFDGNAI
jgi:DNA-binding transcriptional LysR family regulator